MQSFTVEDSTPEAFVARVTAALEARGLASYVALGLDGDEIVARFRWMGTTELRYRVQHDGEGFRAVLGEQRVSPLHAAFRDRFDERFDQILTGVGARVD